MRKIHLLFCLYHKAITTIDVYMTKMHIAVVYYYDDKLIVSYNPSETKLEVQLSKDGQSALREFFVAKADEISDVFSDGPNVNIANLVSMLSKVAPMYSSKWKNIKF